MAVAVLVPELATYSYSPLCADFLFSKGVCEGRWVCGVIRQPFSVHPKPAAWKITGKASDSIISMSLQDFAQAHRNVGSEGCNLLEYTYSPAE